MKKIFFCNVFNMYHKTWYGPGDDDDGESYL
jgi:hypothetical protein